MPGFAPIRAFRFALLSLVVAFSTSTFAANTHTAKHNVPKTAHAAAAAVGDPAPVANLKKNCIMGCPKLRPDVVELGPTFTLARPGYALEESLTDKIPIWVSEFV